MSLGENEKQLKVLRAMMIVNSLKCRLAKTTEEILQAGWEGVAILNQLRIVENQPFPKFSKGGHAIVGEKQPEIILKI